jgi:putative component of membrane protein insertase Oxa1/YidC/SpoIIIJ protein YidD
MQYHGFWHAATTRAKRLLARCNDARKNGFWHAATTRAKTASGTLQRRAQNGFWHAATTRAKRLLARCNDARKSTAIHTRRSHVRRQDHVGGVQA